MEEQEHKSKWDTHVTGLDKNDTPTTPSKQKAEVASVEEQNMGSAAAKTGISEQGIARSTVMPTQKWTLMHTDVLGAKWTMDAQAGRFVA